MPGKKLLLVCLSVALIGFAGCSRQQSDWQKTRESNSVEAYEQFLKKYPSGEFTAQAQARLKDLEEERDWQKARDADTLDAYQAFLKQYPDGKNTEEARIRVENFTLAQTPTGAGPQGGTQGAPQGTGDQAGAQSTGAAPGSPDGSGVSPGAAASAGAQPGASGSASAGSVATASPPGTSPAPAKTQKSRSASSVAGASKPSSASAPSESAKVAGTSKGTSGKYAVQLGAFKSGTDAANKRWEHLQKEYPKLFAGLSSKVVPKKTKGGTLYRLQAIGMSEAHARRICKDLKARSQPCVIVRPAHS
jgi:cell division septation protein DedD